MSLREPTRWTDDDAMHVQPVLADAVRALRERGGDAGQVDALAARLAAQLSAPTRATGSARDASRALGRARAARIAGGTFVVLLAAAWLALRPAAPLAPAAPTPTSSAPLQPPAPRAPSAPGLEPPRAAVAASHVQETPPLRSASPEPAPVRHSARRERADAEAAEGAAQARVLALPSLDPESELQLLGRAQALLDREPAAALELAMQHARRYPRGVFSEEREVLALEAELKLHAEAQALERARRFVREHPRSAHARRVRALLDAAHGPAPRGD